MHKLRWSDLEHVFAVARTGSVAAAARALGVNHSTVLRRVQAFEEQVNIKIFNRMRTGYQTTLEGEIFLDAAASVDGVIQELDRKIAGVDTGMAGEVSVTTTDSLFRILSEPLSSFRRQYPEIQFSLNVSNSRLNLDRRDADIAVRASINPPPHLIGRKITNLRFAIYATPALNVAMGHLPFKERNWLGVDVPLLESVASEWFDQHIPASKIVVRSGSFVVLGAFAEQGAGFALLPRYVGDHSKALVRTDLNAVTPAAGLWVLTHKDVLASPKVRLVSEHLYRFLRKNKHISKS